MKHPRPSPQDPDEDSRSAAIPEGEEPGAAKQSRAEEAGGRGAEPEARPKFTGRPASHSLPIPWVRLRSAGSGHQL